MRNEFDKRIKHIEDELRDLKTASEYSSVRSAAVTYGQLVYTGTYRITYANADEPVFSSIHTGIIGGEDLGGANARTPQGNTQLVDVFTTYINSGGQEITVQTTLVIVSNLAVQSIERL